MNDDTLKTINNLLKSFNNTFEVSANIVSENDEQVADGLKIVGLKSDADQTQFVSLMHDIFNTIIRSISEEHELIYDEDHGLVIAKKIVKTDYKIEDF